MRRVLCTALHVMVWATVVISVRSVEAEDYRYPYRDPYLATVTSANPYFGPATYYSKLVHQGGSHVVILSSPMNWNFALARSRSAAPGYAPDDARDLYEAMQMILSILRSRYAMKISEYLLVNSPLDLGRALAKVDAWYALGAKFGAERSERIVARALAIVDAFSKDRRDDSTIFASVVRDFSGFTREELQFLVAADLQAGLSDLVYVTRAVQAHTTGAAARYQARRRFEDARDVTLARYLEEIALPIWRRQPRAELATFLNRGSLASILDRLRGNPSVRIVHDADDFLADRTSLGELKDVQGDQMILYPYGGHLGNLWYSENKESVLSFFQTTSARSTPTEEVRRSR